MRVELPPGPVHFVNRDEEQRLARRAMGEWQGDGQPLVVVLSGPAGLGKTELSHRLARQELERYPGGVLNVDLDEFRDEYGTVDSGDVIGHLLGALDVEPGAVARQFSARRRQYWDKTRGARIVLVLDNVQYASELTPLLPSCGGSAVIVASHGPLRELEHGSFLDLELEPLTYEKSLELLGLISPDGRLVADPAAVRELLELCGGMPLAVKGAGRLLGSRALQPLPKLVQSLREKLVEQGITDGTEVVWDALYGGLSGTAALLYRLLPHHPAHTFTVESATALLGRGPDACLEALEELGNVGLVSLRQLARARAACVADGDNGSSAGGSSGQQLKLYTAIRAHALRCSRRDADEEEVEAAQTRVLRWLVRQAQRADLCAAGARLVVAPRFGGGEAAPDVVFGDPRATEEAGRQAERSAAASRWLYEHRHVLLAAVRLAHGRALDAETVALSEPVWTYALDHPHQSDVERTFRLALDAAGHDGGRPDWIARMCCQLARPLWESGSHAEAGEILVRAEEAVRLLGNEPQDRKLRASVTEFRGMLEGARGEWEVAAGAFTRSRDIHRQLPDSAYGVALMTYRLGEARAKLGELEAAHALLAEAHEQMASLGRERMTGRTAFALGRVERRLGRPEEARRGYEAALESAARRGSGFDRLRILDAMAELAGESGRGTDAQRYREEADAIRRRNGLLPGG